jgi:hypothetical protein
VISHSRIEPAPRLVGLSGMKFKLKALHHNGIVLTSEELADAPRYVGNLVVEGAGQSRFEACIRGDKFSLLSKSRIGLKAAHTDATFVRRGCLI